MYTLYWIRAKHHTNIETEGYVGITKNFKERMKSHKKNKKKTPLTDAIKSYGWNELLKQEVLKQLDLESALLLEKAFRPTQCIGWNLQMGGELGVESSWYDVPEFKKAHSEKTSEATKLGIKLNDTTEARSLRAKENWKTGAYSGISVGSKNPRALLSEDQVRDIKYSPLYKDLNSKDLGNLFNVKSHVIQFIRSGKNWKHI